MDINNLQTFIVHGHNEALKLGLKNYIQNTLKFKEPIILDEQPSSGRSIFEKFEEYAKKCDLVFVLLTPDDRWECSGERRARQNVILELGYFLGKFGRKSGRVILLYQGELDIPSDIAGIIYIKVETTIEEVGERIRKEIDELQKKI